MGSHPSGAWLIAMVDFETLDSKRIEFGTRNFIEVAAKVARDADSSTETVFLTVARGYRTKDGHERWKTNLTVPLDRDVVEFLQDGLDDMLAVALEADGQTPTPDA